MSELSTEVTTNCPECGVVQTSETRNYSKFSDVVVVGKLGRYYDVCIEFCEECGYEYNSWLE